MQNSGKEGKNLMATVGAVYCVYYASEFLEESVRRIYPLVDSIIFLLNFKPWSGDIIPGAQEQSYQRILNLSDPSNKFKIYSQYWKNETIQRNSGLEILKNIGIDWCLIVDDDELYNRNELKKVLNSLNTAIHVAYLFYHQIYWKNRYTIIEGLFGSFPSLIRTNGLVYFNENRTILVKSKQTWFTISAENIVCHHMSYVRSDDKIYKKLKMSSHAKSVVSLSDWFNNVWLKWSPEMINLGPIVPDSFKKAVPVSNYRLT